AVSGKNNYSVMLRFGHAETMMPLLALMHIPGCYYMTNYFDTVGLHWRDFYVVPMASNLQMVLFRAESGKYYVRVDLNEIPVPLIPGRQGIYIPWTTAREYLNRCLPLQDQL
ncbi:MAG: histidine phosphatase family protein, partial [Duncaniella sp.]|nr:histidine phosphatase family protein [Duncaniella sp.]